MNIQNKNYSRRDFTKITALGAVSLALINYQKAFSKHINSNSGNLNVHLFSKCLQFLDYDEMSSAAKEMGFYGLDLTVRKNGHVLPENVVIDLPKAVSAMRKNGLSSKMMSTNIWDVHDKNNQLVLKTASELGFTHYRTDWLKYPENKSIIESQALYGEQAKELEKLNKKFDLIGGYQNHAGKHVGSPVWDLIPILEQTKGIHMGCQYDIRHAVAEGSGSWELGLRRMKPYINSIVIKDFIWGEKNGKSKPISVPLGEGIVDFNRYFSFLKKNNINVPISLHIEHNLGGAEKGKTKVTMKKEEIMAIIKKDLDYLQNIWKKAQ